VLARCTARQKAAANTNGTHAQQHIV